MPYVREAFSTLGEAMVLDGRSISAHDLRDAEILAIRSTTKVDRALLEGSSVRFVGTATIGTDHLDATYLERAGIRWCHAPGCNATSVAEYVTAALLCLANRHAFALAGKTLGVVGVGNIGSRVARKAAALGMRVLLNDPPRERAEFPDGGSIFVSLDQLLAESHLITLHVPLTREGPDPTYHLADDSFFARMRPGVLFINSARGATVRTDALLAAMDAKTVAHAVIDTWEREPTYRKDLLARVDLGSPHVAGYSFDGKVMGTVMVYREACRFLGVEPTWSPDPLLPPPAVPELEIDAAGRRDEQVLWEVVRRVYDIEAEDRRLREGLEAADHATHFDQLRIHYPVRREFRFTRVKLINTSEKLVGTVARLGFR